MSIKFICSCGKHLRARDELARMRCVCPACGRPVGVPSRAPTQRGTAAEPLGPTQRRPGTADDEGAWWLQADTVGTGAGSQAQSETAEAEPRPRPRGRRKRKTAPGGLDTSHLLEWFGGLLVGLAFWLTTLSGAVLALWLEEKEKEIPWWAIGPFLGVIGAVALGCVWGLWWSVLRATATGSVLALRSPTTDLRLVVKGVVVAAISFLAGPVILVGVALWFWLNSGDLTWVDQFLLAELAVVAAGGWLLAFASAGIGGRLRDALPPGVVRLVWRLGWRVVAWAAVAGVVLVGHGLVGIFALEASHDSIFSWLLLFACWTSLLFWMTALVRRPGYEVRGANDEGPRTDALPTPLAAKESS